MLRGRDRRDRVELEEAELADGVEDVRRRSVEELARTAIRRASSGDTSLIAAPLQPDHAPQPVERPVERVVEGGRRAHAGLAVERLDDSFPPPRSDFRSARPTMRSRQRSGRT